MTERPVPDECRPDIEMRTEGITQYVHCTQCIHEMPAGHSPATWARLNVGFTELGVQVWCIRHKVNVMHIDFEGRRHPAELRALPPVTAQ